MALERLDVLERCWLLVADCWLLPRLDELLAEVFARLEELDC